MTGPHELALKEKVRAANLARSRFIDRCHCENADFFGKAGVRFETAAIAKSEEWALALVAAGLGVAILPEGVARAATGVVLRPIADFDVTRDVGLAYATEPPPAAEINRLTTSLTPVRRKQRGNR